MKTTITSYIGMDLGDRTSTICVLNPEGEVHETFEVKTSRKALRSCFGRRGHSRIVLEVGTHSAWVAQLLRELGHQVIVANPRNVKLISQGHRKCDKRDAELLARLGRADPELLSPIRHRGERARKQLAVVRARDELVATRTSLICSVRGTAKTFGYRIPRCTTPAFAGRARDWVAKVGDDLPRILLPAIETIDTLTEQIKALDREIERIGSEYPEVARLRRVDGVGPIVALTFVLLLEDPRRFRRSRDVGAFLGLCPRRSQSGSGDPELGISKRGDKLMRRLLIHAAHRILGDRGKDSDLRRWGLTLASKGRKAAKKRAATAVARRLAVLLHRLWVSEVGYQPLYLTEARAA